MRRTICAVALAFVVSHGNASSGAAPGFERVSAHCYYMQSAKGEENVAAVVTEEGVLIVDPPSEPRLSIALEALKRLTSKAVRWVVFTRPRSLRDSSAGYFAGQGAVFAASTRLYRLSTSVSGTDSGKSVSPGSGPEKRNSARTPDLSWILFDRQMRLFPANVEIRLFALQKNARTDEDIVLFLPDEKVLLVGGLYQSARYPDIDTDSGGDAIGWIDGVEQVIDSAPLLKPAIPQVKSVAKPEQEKTLEEGIKIVSNSGKVSNLQNMKDLLDASRRLRSEISRAVRAGRTCDDFLASPASSPYRNFANLDSYACQLFQALSRR